MAGALGRLVYLESNELGGARRTPKMVARRTAYSVAFAMRGLDCNGDIELCRRPGAEYILRQTGGNSRVERLTSLAFDLCFLRYSRSFQGHRPQVCSPTCECNALRVCGTCQNAQRSHVGESTELDGLRYRAQSSQHVYSPQVRYHWIKNVHVVVGDVADYGWLEVGTLTGIVCRTQHLNRPSVACSSESICSDGREARLPDPQCRIHRWGQHVQGIR